MEWMDGILNKIPLKDRNGLEHLKILMNINFNQGFFYSFIGVESVSLKELFIKFIQNNLKDIDYNDFGEDMFYIHHKMKSINKNTIIDLYNIKNYSTVNGGNVDIGVQLSFSRSFIIEKKLTIFFIVNKEVFNFLPTACYDVWLVSRFNYLFQDYSEKFKINNQKFHFKSTNKYINFISRYDEYKNKLVTNANIDSFLFIIDLGMEINLYNEVTELIEKCFIYIDKNKDPFRYATLLEKKALILNFHGNYDEALNLFKQAESIYTTFNDKVRLATCYLNQADLYEKINKLKESFELSKRAAIIFIEFDKKEALAKCYLNQSIILIAWGNLDESLQLIEKSEALFNQIGDKINIADCYINKSNILIKRGELEDAYLLLKKAEKIFEEQNNKKGLLEYYQQQSILLQKLGRVEEANILEQKSNLLKNEFKA